MSARTIFAMAIFAVVGLIVWQSLAADKRLSTTSVTETAAEKDVCTYPIELIPIVKTQEQDLELVTKHVKHMVSRPSCFSPDDYLSNTLLLIRLTIAELVSLRPEHSDVESIANAKAVFALQPNVPYARAALELIRLYQSVDAKNPLTILNASKSLQETSVLPELQESMHLVKEALIREALVYTYLHVRDQNHMLDAVIGPFVFDRVKDRFAFAKDVVDAFDEQFSSGAVPLVFLSDVELDASQRKELLIYLITPAGELERTEYPNAVETRAATYMAAGYDVTEVNAAAVDILTDADLFGKAIAYARKHYNEQQISQTEDCLISILRDRGCYAIAEDADGNKTYVYDFARSCRDTANADETTE